MANGKRRSTVSQKGVRDQIRLLRVKGPKDDAVLRRQLEEFKRLMVIQNNLRARRLISRRGARQMPGSRGFRFGRGDVERLRRLPDPGGGRLQRL